jgi:DNA-directed RNA polymerase sigma subunit (sigma70/sigma32)
MNFEATYTNHSSRATQASFPVGGRPVLAARNPGSGYLGEIRRFPFLEKELEYRLTKRWREHGDHKAADQVVTSHLRLAAKIAMSYRGYGLPLSDIISEGNVGLMQAINRFEPEKGLPLRHLCYLVDQGFDSRLHFAILVTCEDRHHCKPEKAVLQASLGQGQDRCP